MTLPQIEFLEPWKKLDGNDADRLLRELNVEVARGHALYGMKLVPLGRSHQADDVLFAMEDGRVVDVHLTHATKTEQPAWPMHRIYSNAEEWAERIMIPLHADH